MSQVPVLYFLVGNQPAVGFLVSNSHGRLTRRTDRLGRLTTAPPDWLRPGAKLMVQMKNGDLYRVVVRSEPSGNLAPIQLVPAKPPFWDRLRSWSRELGLHLIVIGILTVAATVAALVWKWLA